jgi:HSP20 family protein
VNLYETEAGYLACVDLAGVDKDKIDVELTGRRLSIRGKREVPGDFSVPGKVRVHVLEIDHGPFLRVVELPDDAATEQISATYREGLLWLEIPRDGKGGGEGR